jgi:hypothetical protein
LLKYLKEHAQICLLNTDEIIIASKHLPSLSYPDQIKIKAIGHTEFKKKQDMYQTKRWRLGCGLTRPYKLIDNMLM